MRSKKFKQLACISENTADDFQAKTNAILAQTPNPEIVLDKTRPFTAYVFYTVSKSEPETFLEMLEMLDAEAKHSTCKDCPHFVADHDRRKVRGTCKKKSQEVRKDCSACEIFYLERRRVPEALIEEYRQLPFLIE